MSGPAAGPRQRIGQELRRSEDENTSGLGALRRRADPLFFAVRKGALQRSLDIRADRVLLLLQTLQLRSPFLATVGDRRSRPVRWTANGDDRMTACSFASGCLSAWSDRLDTNGTATSSTRNRHGKLVSINCCSPVNRVSSCTSSTCGRSTPRHAPYRGHHDAHPPPQVEDGVLVHGDAVAVEQLLEAVRAQAGVHRGVVGLHVHRAGEDGEGLALHHELIDAPQLLFAEVLAGLRDDEAVEVVGNLDVAVLQVDVLETCRKGSSG